MPILAEKVPRRCWSDSTSAVHLLFGKSLSLTPTYRCLCKKRERDIEGRRQQHRRHGRTKRSFNEVDEKRNKVHIPKRIHVVLSLLLPSPPPLSATSLRSLPRKSKEGEREDRHRTTRPPRDTGSSPTLRTWRGVTTAPTAPLLLLFLIWFIQLTFSHANPQRNKAK